MREPSRRIGSSKSQETYNLPSPQSIFHQVIGFIGQFRRFGWDVVGLLLLLITVLSLLGLFGISRGALLTPWTRMITHYFGWGSILVILMVGMTGIASFRYSAGKRFPLSLGRVLSVEGLFFSLLACLSVFNGLSLERAEAGKDGGVLGWGLATIFPRFISTVLYPFIFIVLVMIAVGVFKKLVGKMITWGEAAEKTTDAKPVIEPKINPPVRTVNRPTVPPETMPALSVQTPKDDRLPPLNLLINEQTVVPDQAQIKAKAQNIEKTLAEFGLPVKVIGFRVGPSVTQFALEPGFISRAGVDGEVVKQKVRVSQIASLSRDLTLALSASSLRIETPVPGRSYVGIEVPNNDNNVVRLRPVLESAEFRNLHSPLALGLGKNVSGEVVAADLEKMPHLLIAGTTNSGKSVCITAITTCLVMNNSPRDLKLVMLDPKMVELIRFNGLPHLLGKVETDTERMLAVLHWAIAEMDARYRLLAEAKTRNIESYNHKMTQKKQPTMPRIVILIDELADLMMTAADQTERSLARLAQMARATGIHLVVATQRPSTDVITGLIKANFPARISFAVASSVDSRVVLDVNGAESLLGKGDMLFLDPTRSGLQRLQGILVNDGEIEKVLHHWQRVSAPVENSEPPWEAMAVEVNEESSDELVEQAIRIVKSAGKASVSLLQRKMRIGYPRAARLIDELEDMGIVGPSLGSGRDREVLVGFDDEDHESEE